MPRIRWVAPHDKQRLPDALEEHSPLQLTSKKQARKLIDKGCCFVNGTIRRTASCYVSQGDTIEVLVHLDSKDHEMGIVYEDEILWILNKPPGCTVDEKSMSRYLSQKFFLVHRLDKDTSGILVVAKNFKTQKILEDQFRKRKIKKGYLAIVDGVIPQKKGTIEKPITRKEGSENKAVCHVAPSGKYASTDFTVVTTSKETSLVYLLPKTGRTHQLRVHMAHLGYPIVGDYRYAESFACRERPQRHLLHSWKIALFHPVFEKELVWTAPIPSDMNEIAQHLFGRHFKRKLCEFSL